MTADLSPAALGQAAEATVVALAMTGDSQAFCELVRRRQGPLRNLLRRLSRDAALADDLAQQVFIKAWRALPKLRSVAAYGAWLRRLAVNTWLEHVRASGPAGRRTRHRGAGRAPPMKPAPAMNAWTSTAHSPDLPKTSGCAWCSPTARA